LENYWTISRRRQGYQMMSFNGENILKGRKVRKRENLYLERRKE
jgi:hypothetical protein